MKRGGPFHHLISAAELFNDWGPLRSSRDAGFRGGAGPGFGP